MSVVINISRPYGPIDQFWFPEVVVRRSGVAHAIGEVSALTGGHVIPSTALSLTIQIVKDP